MRENLTFEDWSDNQVVKRKRYLQLRDVVFPKQMKFMRLEMSNFLTVKMSDYFTTQHFEFPTNF